MTVLPIERRGATRLSPYIRHGLLANGVVVDPSTAKGPIRIRRTRRCGREVDG